MKNVLVPISFSESSKNALLHALLIVRELEATIHLLHSYPAQTFNRVHNFGNKDYDIGIKQMLVNLYKECIDETTKQPFKALSFPEPASDVIKRISHQYQLLIMSRMTGYESLNNKWLSEKMYSIITNSEAPVLLLSKKTRQFTFSKAKTIWHIERKSGETADLSSLLLKFRIDPKAVVTKSIEQQTFTSNFWKDLVNNSKTQDDIFQENLSNLFAEENIDLLVLVNHKKGVFEKFMKDRIFQIISQFDLPILIIRK